MGDIKEQFRKKSKADKIISIILIIVIIFAVLMTIYLVLTPKQAEKYTEFYILGPGGKATDYPTNLTLGEEGKVIIGIINHETNITRYRLVIKYDGTIIEEKDINLEDTKKLEYSFTFKANQTGKNHKLEFLLYKDPDRKNVYRSVFLLVNVT